MEYSASPLLRITLVLLNFFYLSVIISASGLLKDLNTCGDHHLSYLDTPHSEVFYLNGEIVDRFLFCEELKYCQVNHCLIEGNVGYRYCGSDFSLGMVYLAQLL